LGRDGVEDALARFIDIKKHVPIVTLIDGQRDAEGIIDPNFLAAIVFAANRSRSGANR
jgi:hypothetical protein